jgi:hypothetical protein
VSRADRWRIVGHAIVGASGSITAGLSIYLLTPSIFATALAGLFFAYLAIAVTSGSIK